MVTRREKCFFNNTLTWSLPDYLEKSINFDELFKKNANIQSIMRNAMNLSQSIVTTENADSETIQNLEIRNAELQSRTDAIEAILREETEPLWAYLQGTRPASRTE